MPESNAMLSVRESYAPNKWTKFLWWLSTAEQELLKDCVIDRSRYAIVGYTVLCTWLFATAAWSYFFSTVVNNIFIAAMLGLFMGGIILCIDRALIKGIQKTNKKRMLPLLFRLLLAGTIGTFMAQPALLYLFDKEIQLQISLDNEQRKKQKALQQNDAFLIVQAEQEAIKKQAEEQLSAKYKEVSAARNNFIAETDGTGGSKKVGLENIAKAKKREYEKLDDEYRLLAARLLPNIQQADSILQSITYQKQKEQQLFQQLLNDGFLTRIEALQHLTNNHTALQIRYWLLVAILILIELMPVISKMMLPAGSYEQKVLLREEMEKEIVAQNIVHEKDLKQHYNQITFETDKTFIAHFVEDTATDRKDHLKSKIGNWNPNLQTYDDVWGDVKKEMLSKQEF